MTDRSLLHSIFKVIAVKVVLLTLLWFAFVRPNVRHIDAQQTAAALGLDIKVSSTSAEGVKHGQ